MILHRPIIYNFDRVSSLCIKCVHVRKKSYSSLDYCINLVRSLDNENYLCTLLLPAQMRTAALAIRAFNVEVASVQDQVSQAQLGLMRMKFWEETVDKVYKDKVPNNPVAVELAKAVRKHKLSKPHLKKLVSCRTRRLDQPSFSTVREMETYADESCGSLLLLLLQVAGIKSAEVEHAASHLGMAQGLTNLLRGVPHCATKRVLSLPSDLLAHYGVSEESVFRGNAPESLAEVVLDVSDSAHMHLLKARSFQDDMPPLARKIFLPAIATKRYLKLLRRVNCNVFDPSLQMKNPFLPIKLYYNSLTGNY